MSFTKPPRLALRQRGKHRYWIIRDGDIQRGTGATQAETGKAEAALADYISDKARKAGGSRHPAQVPIADVLGDYAEEHAEDTKGEDTIAMACSKLGEFFGERVVDEITPVLCGEYIKWRTAQPDARYKDPATAPRVKEATAGRELVVLQAAIGWAYKHRRLDFAVPVAVPKAAEPRTRHLTRQEAARLLRAARRLGYRHLCRFILLGLYTGTRHRALLELQWVRNTVGGHLDLDAGILYRRAEDEVASTKRRTPCPIPPRLTPHVRAWSRQGGQYVISWGGWQRPHGSRGWTVAETDGSPITSDIGKAWHAARRLAGLGEDVVPHTLRHTAATWLLQAGRTCSEAAGVLGTTEAVIERTYGHHAQDHLRRVVGAFSRRRA